VLLLLLLLLPPSLLLSAHEVVEFWNGPYSPQDFDAVSSYSLQRAEQQQQQQQRRRQKHQHLTIPRTTKVALTVVPVHSSKKLPLPPVLLGLPHALRFQYY
jgi:hypothetical protein